MRPIRFQPTRQGVLALIEDCVKAGGTDIHLKAPGRPQIRVRDRLVPTIHDRLTADDMHRIVTTLTEIAKDELPLARLQEVRFAFGLEGLGRFRVQAVRQRGSWSLVVHVLASDPPSLGQVGLDAASGIVAPGAAGLVLVGGGRARQAVLASLIRQYNQEIAGHIVSVEDPMEYLHGDAAACVTQREVGQDVATIADGLRAAMRLDPDVVVVSDVPDAESADLVLRLAEEGLLVIAGLASSGPGESVRTFIRRFPSNREEEIASRVAAVLRGHVSAPKAGAATWSPVEDHRIVAVA